MKQKDWKGTLLPPTASAHDAIRTIDAGALQICLVVDENRRLLGTVTDGDIRRAILSNGNMDVPVDLIMNKNPRVAKQGTSEEDLKVKMATEVLHHIPLLDERGCVTGLASIDDLLSHKKPKDNWVVLMAGGMGTRLKPLTEDMPKPLLAVGNKPILETILENFVHQNFHRFYISVNYKAEAIRSHFGDGSRWDVEIRYLEEKEPLGTSGALRLLPERHEDPLVVMNGDLLTHVNFQHLLNYHQQRESQATMCVREYDLQVPFGVVQIEEDRLKKVDEKPIQRFFVNAGIYVLDPGMIDLIPADTPYDMTTLFENIIQAGNRTAVFPIHEYWLDIGRIDDLNLANMEFDENFGR